MAKQNMDLLFDDLRDNNDKGAREYRIAEGLAPMTGAIAPVTDTDLALFNGHLYQTTAGATYIASNVTDTTTTWALITVS